MNFYDEVKHYTRGEWQRQQRFGDKQFYAFHDNNDNEFLFKAQRPSGVLSEVFHTHVGNKLGLPCTQNKLATLTIEDTTLYGVSSKNFLESDELFLHTDGVIKCSEYFEEKERLQWVDLYKLTQQLRNKFPESEHMDKSIAENFLMSHISQNHDMTTLRNTGIILPRQTMSPSFDFEFCSSFTNIPLETKIHPQNVNFLQDTQPELIEKFLDNLSDLRNSPDFRDMCNFTTISNFWSEEKFMKLENTTLSPIQKLSRLAKTVHYDYNRRFEQIATALTAKEAMV